MPYAPESKEQALHPDGTKDVFPLDIHNLKAYAFAVKEYFDAERLDAFARVCNGGVYNGSFVLHAGGCAYTHFIGEDYFTDVCVRGNAAIGVRCFDNGDRYEVRLCGKRVDLVKLVAGKDTLLQSEFCMDLQAHGCPMVYMW